MKKKTHEEYVAELEIKNPNIEVVGRYINALTKIEHHCLIHDVYWNTTPSRALQGVGCELCHSEKISASKYKTHEQYVNEVAIVNPNIVVLEKYIDAKTPIMHKCTLHNIDWLAYPDNILKGCGCKECGNEKIHDKNCKTHERYVNELNMLDKNVLVVDKYVDALTPILHKCTVCGYEWRTAPSNILSGKGCPKCNDSHGEKQISKLLDKINIVYERQKTFDDCKDKKPLPFDFYLPDYNTCIEYDGEQHYRPINYFGGEKRFEYIVKHDNIKTNYCNEHNIHLLRIPYNKNIEEELNNFLFI